MSEMVLVAVGMLALVAFVAGCVVLRPGAADGLARVLYALAAVIAAIWPWSRRP